MKERDLNARATVIGDRIRQRFERMGEICDLVAQVRGLGAMIAVEFCHDGDPGKPATAEVAQITAACREQGVLVIPASRLGNVIRILCPLVIEDASLARGPAVIVLAVLAAAQTAPVVSRSPSRECNSSSRP